MDYIAFLKQRYGPTRPRTTPKRTKLANDAFIGMWRSRKDLQDSTTWVRKAREREWVRDRA